MAMSLALLGLRNPGIGTSNPACVPKAYPGSFTTPPRSPEPPYGGPSTAEEPTERPSGHPAVRAVVGGWRRRALADGRAVALMSMTTGLNHAHKGVAWCDDGNQGASVETRSFPDPDCWLSPLARVDRSPIEGEGLFVAAPIARGTVTSRFGGRLVTDDELRQLFAQAAGTGLDWQLPQLQVQYGQHWVPILREHIADSSPTSCPAQH